MRPASSPGLRFAVVLPCRPCRIRVPGPRPPGGCSSGRSPTGWRSPRPCLVGFFLTPYLVRRLGDGPYGVWAFVESVLAYFTLFDLGIAACVVRFVARFHATGDRDELNRLVSTCLALFLGLGLMFFAVGAGRSGAPVSIEEAGVPPDEVVAFSLLMVANLAVTLPLSLFPSVLDGLERFALKSAVRVAVLAAHGRNRARARTAAVAARPRDPHHRL